MSKSKDGKRPRRQQDDVDQMIGRTTPEQLDRNDKQRKRAGRPHRSGDILVERDYPVGYKKPPKDTRFQQGNQAARGRGRPKGSRNRATVVKELADFKHVVTMPDGRTRTMTLWEAGAWKQAIAAARGGYQGHGASPPAAMTIRSIPWRRPSSGTRKRPETPEPPCSATIDYLIASGRRLRERPTGPAHRLNSSEMSTPSATAMRSSTSTSFNRWLGAHHTRTPAGGVEDTIRFWLHAPEIGVSVVVRMEGWQDEPRQSWPSGVRFNRLRLPDGRGKARYAMGFKKRASYRSTGLKRKTP